MFITLLLQARTTEFAWGCLAAWGDPAHHDVGIAHCKHVKSVLAPYGNTNAYSNFDACLEVLQGMERNTCVVTCLMMWFCLGVPTILIAEALLLICTYALTIPTCTHLLILLLSLLVWHIDEALAKRVGGKKNLERLRVLKAKHDPGNAFWSHPLKGLAPQDTM